MEISKKLYVTNRKAWRSWLAKNYAKAKDIWLIFPKKHTGKKRLEYNAAVEEALCFGWIDSTVKTIDVDHFAQRFSPRNPRTPYSQANWQRLQILLKQKKVIPSVRTALKKQLQKKFVLPPDLLQAIKATASAWENFQKYSKTYKTIRLGYINGARSRPKEFKKRLNYFLKMTAQNKQFGFGGIEKYY